VPVFPGRAVFAPAHALVLLASVACGHGEERSADSTAGDSSESSVPPSAETSASDSTKNRGQDTGKSTSTPSRSPILDRPTKSDPEPPPYAPTVPPRPR
jgi:hypothetical protein